MGRIARWAALSFAALAPAMASPLAAQDLGCRIEQSTSGPPRQILRCAAGPVIEAEETADVRVFDKAGHGKPTGARIETGAALLEVPPHYPGGFQILTPKATASVRGTKWVVDVAPERTSVFVVEGQVSVQRPKATRSVVLNRGDGVEVPAGDAPLAIERWAPERAAALLARFGR